MQCTRGLCDPQLQQHLCCRLLPSQRAGGTKNPFPHYAGEGESGRCSPPLALGWDSSVETLHATSLPPLALEWERGQGERVAVERKAQNTADTIRGISTNNA
jgi:hypothetical protein